MSPILFIETNFLAGIAKGQDPEAQALLQAPATRFQIVLPGMCIMESYSLLEWELKQRRKFREEMVSQGREAGRAVLSGRSLSFSQHLDQAVRDFDEGTKEFAVRLNLSIGQVAERVNLLAITPEILRQSLQSKLVASPTDNLILHTILDHVRQADAGPKAFVSGNRSDFEQPDPLNALAAAGVRYFSRVDAAVGWLGAQDQP